MRIILSIFALSMFLTSCEEVTVSGDRSCGLMYFSDALPVQWWLADCETFNEFQAEGVHNQCWCQPWLCSRDLITQFTDPRDNPTLGPILFYKRSDGLVALAGEGEFTFEELQSGDWVYTNTLNPQESNLCGDQYQFFVASVLSVITMPTTDLWTTTGAGFADQENNYFAYIIPNNSSSAYFDLSPTVPVGESVTIELTIDVAVLQGAAVAGSEQVSVIVRLQNAGGTTIDSETFNITSVGAENHVVTLTTPVGETATRITIQVAHTATGGSPEVQVLIYLFDDQETVDILPRIFAFNESGIMAKTDCIDIQESHDECIEFSYSNHRNFAGIIYENQSPDLSFNILIPGRFYHEREPQEDNAIELTSSVVTTSSQVKTQRLLEIKHAPYYFHKKLRRVLQHSSVTSLDRGWEKEESYEVNEGRKTHPFKSSTVWLTETDSVVRNVI